MEIHSEFRVRGTTFLWGLCRAWLEKMPERPEQALEGYTISVFPKDKEELSPFSNGQYA